MQYGVFNLDEKHRSFSSLVQMDSLPASSRDQQVIRLLGIKQENQCTFDFTADKKFLKRFFTDLFGKYIKEDRIKVDQGSKHRSEASKVFYQDEKVAIGKMDNIQHRVQNFMIDRSCINLDCKKIQLLNLQLDEDDKKKPYLDITEQKEWDLYELSQFLNKVQQKYGKNIEDHLVLMKLTDSLFEGSTRFYYIQITMYFLYLVPFFYQLIVLDHITDDKTKNFYDDTQEPMIILCNLICIVIAFGFFAIEVIQTRVRGFWDYMKDDRSFEIAWFFLQVIYFLMKVFYPDQSFPLLDYVDSAELNGHPQSVRVLMIFAFLNSSLLVLISLKLFYFLTVISTFGTMIALIYQTISQIKQFLLFYFWVIFIFSCIMMCLGYDMTSQSSGQWNGLDNDRRVFNENSIAQYFILNFLNSVGQISPPSTPLWQYIKDNDDNTPLKGLSNLSKPQAKFMILIIWAFFVVIVIFLFIILGNFLIAYISQSYEDVLENKIRNKYSQRCILNDEYYLFRSYMSQLFPNSERWKMEPFNCFILTADFNKVQDSNEGHDNVGVIKKVQNILIEHKQEIHSDVTKNRHEMENVRDEMSLYRKEMNDLIREIQDTKDNITGMVKQNLNNNNYIMHDVIWPDYGIKKLNTKALKLNFANPSKANIQEETGLFEPLELKDKPA